jgi:hypothetical protein
MELTDSPFSQFIRNATDAEKREVYADVLRKATERQLECFSANQYLPTDNDKQ